MLGSYFHSYILAQVLGLYCVVMAVVMVARTEHYRNLVQTIDSHHFSLMLGSSIALLFGLFLIDIHTILVFKPVVLVTLVAWFITIKAVCWLAMPEKMIELSKQIYSGSGYYVMVAILGIVGIVLMTCGFYHFSAPGFDYFQAT